MSLTLKSLKSISVIIVISFHISIYLSFTLIDQKYCIPGSLVLQMYGSLPGPLTNLKIMNK